MNTDPAARSRRVRLALFLYLFGAAAYFMPGASWAPVSRFSLTRAIVERGTFEITRYAESTGDRALVGKRYYTEKAPIPSFLAVPAYAVYYSVTKARGRFPAFKAEGTVHRPATRVIVSPAFRRGLYVCSLSTSGLAVAVLGAVLFGFLRRRTTERAALFGSVASILGTPLFAYGVSFFGHALAAAFLFGAFVLFEPRGDTAGRLKQALAGACLVLSAGSEYIVAAPAALLAVYFVLRSPRERRAEAAFLLAAGAAAPAALLCGYHAECFGSPFGTGYSFVTHPAFAPGHATGVLGITFPKLDALYGMFFGAARGLFYVSPLALVGLVGGHLKYRQTRDRALLVCVSIFATLVLINSSYYRWDGGLSVGPRHVVPALGFVGVLVGLTFTIPRLRAFAAFAAGYSCLVIVLVAAVGVEVPSGRDVLFEYLLPAIERGEIARVSGSSNLGLELGLGRRQSLLPVLGWLLLGAFALGRLCPPEAPVESPARGDP